MSDFTQIFGILTGYPPLHWQRRLHTQLLTGDIPSALDLPTGLGKTSVMAVWLAAKLMGAPLPNRLVYVVDRRTVVDQATAEAEKLRENARKLKADALPENMRDLLTKDGLAISTLRGEYLDNRLWMEDPAVPAIIVGTVDMIGSRLLFHGYGLSTGMRPFQAGLLGNDTLLVLDEAHLCPPFQALLASIADGGKLRPAIAPIPPFRLLALSATGKDYDDAFTLLPEDGEDAFVQSRLTAAKHLTIIPPQGKLDEQLALEALALAQVQGGRIAIFCTSREVAQKVSDRLRDKKAKRPEGAVVLLAGARRVKEREHAWTELRDAGFLPPVDGDRDVPSPSFLVATAAGEVGVDLDADHAIMDLVAAERMIQRLGRVNRTGGEGRIAHVRVIDAAPDKETDDAAARRDACRRLLENLPLLEDGGRNASPGALRALRCDPLLAAASTPAPLYPALDRATLDAWAMTSLRDHPGRADIAPWLRGWVREDDPEITLVWRRWPWDEEYRLPDDKVLEAYFDKARPRLLEQLSAPVSLALKVLAERAKKFVGSDGAVVVLALEDGVRPLRLDHLRDKKRRERFFENAGAGTTFIIHQDLGGLDAHGLLSIDAPGLTPCLDEGWDEQTLEKAGLRIVEETEPEEPSAPSNWRPVDRFNLIDPKSPDAQRFLVVQTWREGDRESGGDPAVRRKTQELAEHLDWAAREAGALADKLGLAAPYRAMLVAAAASHELGKKRPQWQRAMGAPRGGPILAKTTGKGANPALLKINNQTYRHEFGSLLDLERAPSPLADLPDELRELALHLVASHHC